MNRACAALLGLLIVPAAAFAQLPAATTASPKPRADFSREPFVIEQYFTSARFENNGTGDEILRVRVRVQSAAGVRQWSELVFGYNAAAEKIAVHYARVRKADGTTVSVGPGAVKDQIAAAANSFPAYLNYKETRVAVSSLAAGETLEYEIEKRIVAPAAPGEFWFEHAFVDSAVVLDERLEINVPAARKVILKSSPAFPSAAENLNGRAIYRWKHLNSRPIDRSSAESAERARARTPDVQLTTFASWEAVARWYAKVSRGRAEPAPEIHAKAQELIRDRTSDIEKMQALYEWVSKNIRDTGLPLGAAGYQPRTAAEILANQYADSADKHTLLAAMLSAAGFSSDAVLMPSSRKLDAVVPSPAQFDHVITLVPLAKDLVWMDSTVDIAPFRMLAAGLRAKSALVISPDGAGKICETPADPPFLSTQQVDITGQLSELGKLTATARYSVRGDTELVLRSAFRKARESQWNEIGRTILSLDGIHGDVVAVKPGDPKATQDPFQLEIRFAQPSFFDWATKKTRTALPLLAIGLPDPPANKTQPIDLGSPLKVTVKLTLHLPPSFSARPPIGVSIAHDYADFKTSYQFADHVVSASRSLDFKMRSLPASRADEYAAFARAVAADQLQPLAIENTEPGPPAVPSSASADELFETGNLIVNSPNRRAAIPLLERATQLDPKHEFGWDSLGLSYESAGRLDDAIAAFRKQLEVAPSDDYANLDMAHTFEARGDYASAESAFRKQVEAHPLDALAHAFLGMMLMNQERDYARAVPELEKAAILWPKTTEFQIDLGMAYAKLGRSDDAMSAFDKALSASPEPFVRREVAFAMADSNLALDEAQRYAEFAVSAAEAQLRDVDLKRADEKHMTAVQSLGDGWDTLGWVAFKQGDSKKAERLLDASWLLNGRAETADRLAQLYEKLGDKDRAIHACALSLAVFPSDDTRARLTLLLHGNAQIDDLVAKAKPELETLRSIPAGKLVARDVRADFLVLLSASGQGSRVDGVRFIGGDDVLRPFADRLRALDYHLNFPDGSPIKLLRGGTLACSAATGECNFLPLIPGNMQAAP